MRKALFALLLLVFLLMRDDPERQAEIKTVSTNNGVTTTDVRFYSKALDRTLWYRMILPAPRGGERLPVLYLLHGANSGPGEMTARAEIERLAADERLAVVIPDGEFSYYTNAKHKWHARWEDAITHDLVADVQARFPVLSGREHTGVAGISMGGYGAAKLALKHPELYGFVGVMSGALDITRRPASTRRVWQTWRIWTIFGYKRETQHGEDVFDLLRALQTLPQTAWFASCGEKDPLHDVNERFAQQVSARDGEMKLVTTKSGHDWRSWNEAMPQMFVRAGKALR